MTTNLRPGDRPLRIAMVAACPFPYPRGTPIRIFRMAEALANRGHEVHVVTYHLGQATENLPFHVHRIPDVRTYRDCGPGPSVQKLALLDPLLCRELTRVLRQYRIDVIHAHHYEGLLVSLAIRGSTTPPVVYDAHTLLDTELPYYGFGFSSRLKSRVGAMFDRHLPGRAAHVISVTSVLRDRLVAMGAVVASKATVIENGVEGGLFDSIAAAPTAHETVIFTGNLAPYQGMDQLIHAMAGVHARRPDARLLVVTDSSFAPYEMLARALGVREHIDVVNAGFDRLPSYLLAADVAVNPRVVCDGVPQKLMNYMAAGRPIVSFPGSAAHLRHGSTGWIALDSSPAALADGIVRLLGDPALARRLGAAAREQILRDFSWEGNAEKTESVYGQVLQNAAPALQAVRPSGSLQPLV
jgi:glycosyltransferase involved in cell wall biosynthesis